jgi:hypothetical protein
VADVFVVKRKVDRGDDRQEPGKDRQDLVRDDGPCAVRVPPRKRVDCGNGVSITGSRGQRGRRTVAETIHDGDGSNSFQVERVKPSVGLERLRTDGGRGSLTAGVVEIKTGAKQTRPRQAVCGEGQCKCSVCKWTQAPEGGEGARWDWRLGGWAAQAGRAMAKGTMTRWPAHLCMGAWINNRGCSLREGRAKGEKGSPRSRP